MTCPGSISTPNIQFQNLRYLTDNTIGSITSADFDLESGKPKSNLSNSSIVNTFFTNVASNLHKNKNINENFIYKYPKVLEVDALRDIHVTDETTIEVIFILTGASMKKKNMFGYYMYYVDDDGNKQLLSNADNTEGYYYASIVIYPFVYSVANDPSTIQVGQTMRW